MKSVLKPSKMASEELQFRLNELLKTAKTGSLSNPKRKALELEIKSIIQGLNSALDSLDPIKQPASIFDPSNPKIIGRFVALALVAQDKKLLVEVPRFYGSGVYAIYYTGKFDLYASLAKSETPIYVGQAAPSISNARTPTEQGAKLYTRLNEHKKNISKSATLDIDDFQFRSLVVQSGWETAAEDYLIHMFKPIWNNETSILYGLGKHGDAAETRANKRSPWDTLHPGRNWAKGTTEDAKSVSTITAELKTHFSNQPAFQTLADIISTFISELRQS